MKAKRKAEAAASEIGGISSSKKATTLTKKRKRGRRGAPRVAKKGAKVAKARRGKR